MEENILTTSIISVVLVFLTSWVFYEILCMTLRILSKFDLRTRPLMFFLVGSIFSAHIVAILMYGFVYWALVNYFGFEPLSGITSTDFFGYFYFSTATYSSLGIGDVFPHGPMQVITAIEVLNGLMLIGWSVMVTYFAVEKLWNIHGIGLYHDSSEEDKS